MKKISVCLIAVLCMLFNICANAADISYTTERTEYSKAISCAYNGSTYVLVGTAGMICVSSDLQNWEEIKNVCYTDIENVIWDGSSFVFIAGGNVYKSADGITWQKSPCEFAAGNDFCYVNGKYLVKRADENVPGGAVVGTVGLTSNFEDFEETNFGQAADSSKLSYTFSPEVYYKNGIYFAQGLVSNILYSSDLTDWNTLPDVPNKNNTDKKLLLFACVNDEYILYYDENNAVTAYSITLSDPVWEKHELNMPKMLGDKIMQQTSGGIYCFAPFNKAFCSSNGYDFEAINYETSANSKVYILNGIYAAKMICSDGVYIGFSIDGVYFTKIKLSDDFAQLSKRITNNSKSIFYAEGNKIVYNEYGYKMTFDIDNIKTGFGASDTAYVKVNNKILGFDTPPVIESGRTLVPLRFIFETMGADVNWDGDTQTAIVTENNTSVKFSIDNATATVDGTAKTMDVPARLINDKTLVPLRFLSEELGFVVEWNEAERLVTISQ